MYLIDNERFNKIQSTIDVVNILASETIDEVYD